MGFFSNLFGKKTCALCGAECGVMHRDKIKNKEYVCSDCARKCSQFVRLSEMDKETVREHIDFMAKRNRIHEQCFKKTSLYPSTVKEFAIEFCDDIGMLSIFDRRNVKNKVNREVIRYDEIASYEYYKETDKPSDGGAETFKEDGVILRLVQPLGFNDAQAKKGLRPHPYIKREIKLCFRKSEKDTDYADNALQHLDFIFGVHDSERGLFSFGLSKAQKRDLKATTDMAKIMGGIINAAVSGNADPNDPALQEQMAKAQESVADAKSGGLAVYSRRADEAENSVEG